MALFTVALYFTLELEILKAVWPYLHGTIPGKPPDMQISPYTHYQWWSSSSW
jgi:hypothetical protein